MKYYFFKILQISVMLIVLANAAYAQTGKIAGKVIDKVTGETLIGLTVGIDGTTKGTSTDVEGRFVIPNLADGKYSVTFRYLGYQTKTISGVDVKAGQVTSLNVIMEESSKQALNEVVVTATYRQATVGALYAQQKNAIAISDGISSDVIKRSPDRNTGEVIKRVSGASVQDNKFIIIRGLSDRYNNALINTTPLPSTEPDRKTFSFDIIPSSLIDNVIISKTATPDIPGDFAGGVIQIKTKDFPTTKTLEFSVGLGYNSVSTFKDFYGRSPGAKGYSSFGASEYHLPSAFPETRTRYLNKSLSERVQISKQFDNTWGVQNLGSALPSQNLSFVFGNAYNLKNEGKLGLILSANYRNSQNISPEVRNDFNEVNDGQTTQSLFQYSDTYYNFSSNLGLLANLSYIKGKNKYALKNLLNNTFENNYL
ncbi:MAG TPA: TonB-dependent receptor, partial [Pelobium sp.]